MSPNLAPEESVFVYDGSNRKDNDHRAAAPPTVVLVDPFSTGVMLQERLFGQGYSIILVWSDRSGADCRAKHFVRCGRSPSEFAAVIVHEGDKSLDKTLDSILQVEADIVAVMCGSEVGVLLEDAVADGLNKFLGTNHLRSSGMLNPKLKNDKYLQAETVRAAGLAAVKQKLAHSEDDVRAFLQDYDGPLKAVVKPQTGAGSVGVQFCESAQAVLDAYSKIAVGDHRAHCSGNQHYQGEGVLVQEYMEGTEYIVNLVVLDGVAKCTAMWMYDKRPYNGGSFVCYSKQLLAINDQPQLPSILAYTQRVLQTFNFRNGAVHAEIMYNPKYGPRLVEINCRLHGGNGAWVNPAETCMGYSQLSVMMDAYLNEGRELFAAIPSYPAVVTGGCRQVKMRSPVTGILEDVNKSKLARIMALPSYREHFFTVRPGEKLLLTVDMPSVPGEVTLVHSDRAVLEADYVELNDILHEGIFKVKPEGGPDLSRVPLMNVGLNGVLAPNADAMEKVYNVRG